MINLCDVLLKSIKAPQKTFNQQQIYAITIPQLLDIHNLMNDSNTNLQLQSASTPNEFLITNPSSNPQKNNENAKEKILSEQRSNEKAEDTRSENLEQNPPPILTNSPISNTPNVQDPSGGSQESTIVSYEMPLGIASLTIISSKHEAFLRISQNLASATIVNSLERTRKSGQINTGLFESMTISSTSILLKNFPKKLGDNFTDFLNSSLKIDLKKNFKDRCSWRSLNEYLTGEKHLDNISTTAFITMFMDFLKSETIESINNSKVKEHSVKECYKILLAFFKESCEIIEKHGWTTKIYYLEIRRSWPRLDLHIKWRP